MSKIIEVDHLEEIHQSNISTVFIGMDKARQEKVAIKVLNEEYPSAHALARFNEEAELGSRLQINGLRKVFNKQKINNRHALVMEYIDGGTVKSLIQHKRKLEIADFLKIAINTASILHEIHRNGVIHKDINPQNLLIGENQEVYIIDLGIAALTKKESTQLEAPDKLEGTLAYISPEQTGRMNHSVDSRSDLYSLGVTFYEMLTGELPFISNDSMELVHSHIAKTPTTPIAQDYSIPQMLSDIVMKLMAKNNDDRYQTSLGLKQDLEKCQEVLSTQGLEALQALAFDLGSEDFSSNFQLPEKLYGRDKELRKLLEGFKSSQDWGMSFITVAGYSGVGKTALIEELYRPVTESRSYFISGKFEQFQKDIPYSAFINAINSLVQQLLGESEARLDIWKKEITAALGSNAGVLTELIPSLELIIGKQPSPIQLPPLESQNRFNSLIQKFFRDLSTQQHGLVIFIDDWQWADSASLNLLKLITTDFENQFLMFLAAYRDNEVDVSHPFVLALEEIKKSENSINLEEIFLKPLESQFVGAIVKDTLNTSLEDAKPLADLIETKTSGNPFFVTQFLERLNDGGYIQYNHQNHVWDWEMEQIEALPISNNVLDLMTTRIELLGEDTQRVLQLASCIGNFFPLNLLSHIYGRSQAETRKLLLPAIEQGLLLPHRGSHYSIEEGDDSDKGVYFRFLHDRVEQAAHQMLDAGEVKKQQWKIGQTILKTASQEYIQESLFDIANFLNNGREYVKSKEDIEQLIKLNYKAGKKAKQSTAYSTANTFLETIIQLSSDTAWEESYERTFDIHREIGESAFLIGDFDKSNTYLNKCLDKAHSSQDKASIYEIQIAQLSGQGKYPDAVKIAIDSLKAFGIELPGLEDASAIEEATNKEIGLYIEYVKHNSIQSLGTLPDCKDPDISKAITLLGMALDCAGIGVPSVLALFAMKITNLSIDHGLVPSSITSFVWIAVIYASGFKDLESAYEISTLSWKLAESREDTQQLLPKVYHIYAYYSYLKIPLKEAGMFDRKAYETGLEVGDFVYGSYGAAVETRFIYPRSLKEGWEKTQSALAFCRKINNAPMSLILEMQIGFLKSLLGQTRKGSLDYDNFQESAYIEIFEESAPLLVAIYKRYKLQSEYIMGTLKEAMVLVEERATWTAIFGAIDIGWRSEYYLYSGLVASVVCHESKEEEKEKYIAILEETIDEIKLLLDCSDNFLAIHQLLLAEKASIELKPFDALNLYDKAIEQADKTGFPQYMALASERAMQLFLSYGKKDIARLYYQKALHSYEDWGATGKVEQLREKYSNIFPFVAKRRSSRHTATSATYKGTVMASSTMHTTQGSSYMSTGGDLDLLSVMKASLAISEEIKLEKLVEKMILVLMENVGAERGLIVQDRGDKLMLAAEARVGQEEVEVMREVPLDHENTQEMALSVIRVAYRTQKTIVLNDVNKDSRFAMDPYIQASNVKSILCLPIVHQGKVRVVVYMEHQNIAGAFTEKHLQVLNMLSSQVAISIENANLYDNMEGIVDERTQELQAANHELQDKNVRITDSINYALTMQQAILPTDEDLQRISEDFHVFYRPKDIVSGDFYWHATVGKKEILAVIDCTGHGVPGAFMSMIGNTLLNEIVNQKEVTDPSQILTMLDEGVQVAMHQEKGQNSDGMDLVICIFEKQGDGQTKVTFTGAKNPLYYIKDGELSLIKGDRRAIGGFGLRSKNKPFTNTELLLGKGDTIYMATDGYIDTGRDTDHKSFSTKRFKEMVQKHHQLTMKEQGGIYIKTLEDFQGNFSQRDDITLLGFKL